jgi:methionyl-tRNA synthetase
VPKTYYVTTSIPYANANPHIGFAMELIQADVLARYARQQGHEVIFSTGTDEHGSKIYEKAQETGVDPRTLTDEMSQTFRSLSDMIDISNNRFIRTTDEKHEAGAQKIWKKLEKDIYKSTYEGLYCVGCEEFVTATTAKENNNTCPIHQKPYQSLKEENYFFRLSKYGEQIQKAIEDNSFELLPASRRNEILRMVEGGLDDISVSRPSDKLPWGVPVPGDEKQVMYVWFEALMNYITVLDFPDGDDFATYWPADVQVIGKDIIRFHTTIWPAMLLAIGVDLPKKLYIHGFISIKNQKISKSIGNVVHPQDVIDIFGVDPLRYYLLRHIPSSSDGDFTWQALHDAYTNELANDLGNAVQRTAVMVHKYLDGSVDDTSPTAHDTGAYYEALKNCQFDRALEEVWKQARGLNQYIDEQQPWQVAKQGDAEHLKQILQHQVASMLQIAELLEPFLPHTAKRIQEVFNASVIQPPETTLFPRVETDILPS